MVGLAYLSTRQINIKVGEKRKSELMEELMTCGILLTSSDHLPEL